MHLKVLTGGTTYKSLKPCNLTNCTKDEIRKYFVNSYELNETLFTGIKDPNAFFKCPDRLRLPLIFYYGHTASVYVNKLILAGLIKEEERIDLGFETLMETGVDEMSWDDTENYRMGGKFQWPSLEEVVAYRRKVKELIFEVIDRTPLTLPVTFDSPWWAMFMGMEHERIHLETSSVLIRQLPVEMVQCPEGWKYAPVSTGTPILDNPMITVKATEVTFGKPLDFPSYGWDNEYGRVAASVPEFAASQFMITNREFLAFIRAGGYTNETYWTEEGWRWRCFKDAKHPAFWVCEDGCKSSCGSDLSTHSHCKADNYLIHGNNAHCNGHSKVDDNGHQGKDEGGGIVAESTTEKYRLRVMFDVIPMPWDWPVIINYLEAKAFCAWRGPDYRLPSEAEHNVIRGTERPLTDGWNCDIIHQDEIPANTNFQFGSSTPVNMYQPNDLGFSDAYGNAWEWCEDHFNGLPGTLTSAYYDDFSTPCYDGRHNLIVGGSWIATGDEASRFARFAFRRHFLQHAGFRVVRSVTSGEEKAAVPIRLVRNDVYIQGCGTEKNPVTLPSNVTYVPVDTTNQQYLHDTREQLAEEIHSDWETGENAPATLIAQFAIDQAKSQGCAGRALYLGCGTGRGAIKLAEGFPNHLAVDCNGRFIDTCLKLHSGDLIDLGDGSKAQFPKDVDMSQVTFKQLTWLPNEVGYFDFIFSTMFDRVINYKAWLKRINNVLNKNGMLVVACYNYGAKEIGQQLSKEFTLLGEKELSVVNGRQRVVKASVWKRF